MNGFVGIYASGNKIITYTWKIDVSCSEFVPVDFLRKLLIIALKAPTNWSPAGFSRHMLVVIRVQVSSPALQAWRFCLDFCQSSQSMGLSAHPPSQPDTQKCKDTRPCCKMWALTWGGSLCPCRYGAVWTRDLVSIFLYSYSKLWDWRLVQEGKQEPEKSYGIESEGIKKWGGGVCCGSNCKQPGPLQTPVEIIKNCFSRSWEADARRSWIGKGHFSLYGNREDQMEASGSFKEGEVCFHTTYSEVTELAARSCNVGPTGSWFQKTVHTGWICMGPLIAKIQLQYLAQKAPNLWVAGGVCKGEFVPCAITLSISWLMLLKNVVLA